MDRKLIVSTVLFSLALSLAVLARDRCSNQYRELLRLDRVKKRP